MIIEINSENEVENAVSDMLVKAKAKPLCSPVKSANPSTNPKPKPRGKAKMMVSSITKEPFQQTPAIPAPIGGSTVNQSRVTEIPAFMGATWTNMFLPTLYDIFGCLGHPFAHFSKGLEVVQNIQEVIDLVWPSSNYKV